MMATPFRVEIQRRYSDIDKQGHVNNVAYFDYLQDARVAIHHSMWHPSVKELQQVIVHQELSYRKSLLLALEPIVVEMWVSKIGNSSYTLAYRVLDENGELAADASSTLACVDGETGRAIRIPEDLRAALEALRIDA